MKTCEQLYNVGLLIVNKQKTKEDTHLQWKFFQEHIEVIYRFFREKFQD